MTEAIDWTESRIAPSREQIAAIDDIRALAEMAADVSDVGIAIETQLEFYDDDAELKGRRVAALIYWRQAARHIQVRIKELRATGPRALAVVARAEEEAA